MGRVSDPTKRILLASPRGFCAGVDRAVVTVEKALDHFGAPVYMRKQIVHNKHVVEVLEERGAVFVDDLDEVPEGSLVVFSAHGVSPAVRQQAVDRNLRTIDATCPLVTKVHSEARRFAADDFEILLIGHDGHEEVEGTSGEAPEHITLVQTAEEAAQVEVKDPSRLVWLSQTTLSVDETMQTVERLRERFPALQDPPSSSWWARRTRRTRCAWSRSAWRQVPSRPTASTTRRRSTRRGSPASTPSGSPAARPCRSPWCVE
jgi:4-hydroxy-3-methylbut-2-enyl diphosphate reductase